MQFPMKAEPTKGQPRSVPPVCLATAATIEAEKSEGIEPDPHRLVDYSARHERTADCNELCASATRDP